MNQEWEKISKEKKIKNSKSRSEATHNDAETKQTNLEQPKECFVDNFLENSLQHN